MPTRKLPVKQAQKRTVPPLNSAAFKKQFSAIRDASVALHALNRPQKMIVSHDTSAAAKALAVKLGYDPRQIEQAESQRAAKLKKLTAQWKADSMKKSVSLKKYVKSKARAWLDGANTVATLGGGPTTHYLVNEPFQILANADLHEEVISPGNSVAKFHTHQEGSPGVNPFRLQDVQFWFQWQNPSNYPTYISAQGFLVAHGTAQAVVKGEWSITGSVPETDLTVVYRLSLSGQWPEPGSGDTPSDLGGSNTEFIEQMVAHYDGNNPFYSHTVVVNANILQGELPQVNGPIAVPANGVVLLELNVQVYGTIYDGSIDVDFLSGDFGLTTPGVLVTKWR